MSENKEALHQEELEQLEDIINEQTDENEVTNESETTNSTEGNADDLGAMKDKYLRLMAEFENFKRRSSRERIELISTASKEMLIALLPIIDDFERAERNVGLDEGMTLIYNKLHNMLTQKGLRAMESTGTDFNAEEHEAITEVPMGDALKGKVIDTVEKGYFLNDKIVRYAKVVVGA